jgi:hypothetical protein
VKLPLAPNKEFAGSPVNVFDLESHHLTGAKTETRKQEQDGIVAAIRCRAAGTGLEHTFNLLRSHISWYG